MKYGRGLYVEGLGPMVECAKCGILFNPVGKTLRVEVETCQSCDEADNHPHSYVAAVSCPRCSEKKRAVGDSEP